MKQFTHRAINILFFILLSSQWSSCTSKVEVTTKEGESSPAELEVSLDAGAAKTIETEGEKIEFEKDTTKIAADLKFSSTSSSPDAFKNQSVLKTLQISATAKNGDLLSQDDLLRDVKITIRIDCSSFDLSKIQVIKEVDGDLETVVDPEIKKTGADPCKIEITFSTRDLNATYAIVESEDPAVASESPTPSPTPAGGSAPTAPTIEINGGEYTTSAAVNLTLSAVNAEEMKISNTTDCSGGTWEPYATTKSGWTLGVTNSTATVSVKYRNESQLESACKKDTIKHDGTDPTSPGSLSDGATHNSVSETPSISWAAATDSNGIDHYEVAIGTSEGAVDTLGWTNVGTATSVQISSGITLVDGQTYYASVKAVDIAGRSSTPALGDGWTVSIPSGSIVVSKKSSVGIDCDFGVNVYVKDSNGDRDLAKTGSASIEVCGSDSSGSSCTSTNTGSLTGTTTAPVKLGFADFTGLKYDTAEAVKFKVTFSGMTSLSSSTTFNSSACYPITGTLASSMNGEVKKVALKDGYAIGGADSNITVWDISTPTTPTAVKTITIDGYFSDLQVSGNNLFVAAQTGGLLIFDVTDPSNLSLTKAFSPYVSASGLSALSVKVIGNYAYVMDYNYGLRIIDISDVTKPVAIGYTYLSKKAAQSVVDVSGNTAIVNSFMDGLYSIDVSSKHSPEVLQLYDPLTYLYDVKISGSTAFLAAGTDGLQAIDISNPASMSVAGTGSAGSTRYLTLSGNTIIATGNNEPIRVVDVSSNPTLSEEGASASFTGNLYGGEISGNYAFMGSNNKGLVVVDISDHANPSAVFTGGQDWGKAAGSDVEGNILAVAGETGGLKLFDVTDKSNPVYITTYNDSGKYVMDVDIDGNYAYLAMNISGINIVDISNPASPTTTKVHTYPSDNAYGIQKVGNLLYVANNTSRGIEIIDVSDVNNPAHVANIGSTLARVKVTGTRAYATGWTGGTVYIYDISTPATPSLLGSFVGSFSSCKQFAAQGNYVYTTHSSTGFKAYDASNPASVSEADSIASAGYWLTVQGNYVYSQKYVIDISDPTDLTVVSKFSELGMSDGTITIDSGALYVTPYYDGTYIFTDLPGL